MLGSIRRMIDSNQEYRVVEVKEKATTGFITLHSVEGTDRMRMEIEEFEAMTEEACPTSE